MELFDTHKSTDFMCLGCEVNHPPPSSAQVKNEWSYTSTPPACLHSVDREKVYHLSPHHRHVQEVLGLIPVPCILKMKLVPPSLPRSSYVSSSFGLYCRACLSILFVSILSMCCSHFSWYCFISFTVFSAPVFSVIHWFFFI